MKERLEHLTPRARTEGLVVQNLEDEVLVYDLERHKAHSLNRTAAIIWRHCDGRTTLEELARLLKTELKTEVDEELVCFALEQLGRDHLLEERAQLPMNGARMSRRALMLRLGMAAALVPLVTTISAPTANAATSCVGVPCPGGTCPGICICNAGTCQ